MHRKALLLGPDGQLGRAVRRAHADAGGSLELASIPRARLDVADRDAVERVLGGLDFDILVNCAAYTRVDDAEDDAGTAFAVNAHAVQAMARVCAAKRSRLLHVGTDYVFGGGGSVRHPLREHDPVAPLNVYGASKAMGETLACRACDDVVILRVAALFGRPAAGHAGSGNFVETVIRVGREKGALRVVDDQTTSPTAAADVARIVVRILRDGCAPGLYHAVNSGSATWFDLAREVVRRAGVEATVAPCSSREFPVRAERPRYSALDNAKVMGAFGPMPAWQDALERYLECERDSDR